MQKLYQIPKGNSSLIDRLIAERIITSKIVEETLKSIDRADFCDISPYEDRPQGIGNNFVKYYEKKLGFSATISAPHMHAHALEFLKDNLVKAKKSLDVGSGSGYLTLAFAKMQQNVGGIAYGIVYNFYNYYYFLFKEHIPNLVDISKKNINKNHSDYLATGKVVIVEGDGRLGLPDRGPFDCIHVGAAAKELHSALVEQLAPLGRMVIPVDVLIGSGQDYLVVDKSATGEITKKKVLGVSYVPLTSKENQCPSRYFKI